jgi:hypothetical protein
LWRGGPVTACSPSVRLYPPSVGPWRGSRFAFPFQCLAASPSRTPKGVLRPMGHAPWNPHGFGNEAEPLQLRALRGARRATPLSIIGSHGI